jgi:hypothetical protein
MTVCPVCRHELQTPPKDMRDWFRCEKCGTPLRVPSSRSKMLYWFSIFGVLLAATTFPFLLGKYIEGREFTTYFIAGLLGGTVLAVYAGLARFLWNTKFSPPRPYDPYSSLNLSDGCTKFRGHVSEAPPHNPFRDFISRLQTSRYSHPCPACLRIIEPQEIQERNSGYFRCPACGEWLQHDLSNGFRITLVSSLLALILSWQLGYRGALFGFALIAAFLFISVTAFFLCEIFFPSGYIRAGG